MTNNWLSFIKNNKIKLSILPVLIAIVVLLNYLIMPLAIKTTALKWIKKQESIKTAKLQEISFNLFNGVTKIKEISFTDQGNITTQLDNFHLNLDIWPYWKKNIKIRDVLIKGVTLNITHANNQLSIGGINLKSKDKKPKTTSPNIKSDWSVDLIGPINLVNNSIVYKNGQTRALIKEENLAIKGSLSYKPKRPQPLSGQLNINLKNFFSSIEKGKHKNQLKLGALSLSDINLYQTKEHNLSIKKVELNKLKISMVRSRNGETLVHQLKSILPPTTKKKKKPTKPLSFYIEKININSNSNLSFTDRGVKPASKLQLNEFDFKLGAINSHKKDYDTPIKLSSKLSKYSSIELEGNIRPFSRENLFDLKGRIKSFNLLSVSPYSAKYIDHSIQRGHLNSRIKGKIKKNRLNVQTSTKISKLAITATKKKKKKNRFTQMFGLPMGTAISLLSDKEENINIDIPVKGNIKDPEFQIVETIQSAVAGAIKNNAFGYLAPLGIQLITGVTLPPGTLFLTELAFKQASTIGFKPLEFVPLQEKLAPKTVAYLKQVSKMIKSRPKIRLLICPQINKNDIAQIATSLKELTDKQKKELLEIADNRGKNVMDFLVEEGKIKPEQLFICASEIKEKIITPNVAIYM